MTKESDTPPNMADAGASNAVQQQALNDSLPFRMLGHYEIVSRIGQGGMGDVYLGLDRSLDRKVAIKVLPAEFTDQEDFVRRFQVEAAAAAMLIHPNVVQIYFNGQAQGYYYFSMQFVDGESLAELMKRRIRLSVDEGLPMLQQIFAGLAAVHRHGLVHRDIKPGNVLIDQRQSRALLADFGLVKSLQASLTGKTATGVIMGTPDYMSPEQALGKEIDQRADLYSMGVLMYQIFSGRLPFEADSPTALIFQHVYETPPPLARRAPGLPQPIVEIVEKLLRKSPDDRYQCADDVLADLGRFQTERHVLDTPAKAAVNSRQMLINWAYATCAAAVLGVMMSTNLFSRASTRAPTVGGSPIQDIRVDTKILINTPSVNSNTIVDRIDGAKEINASLVTTSNPARLAVGTPSLNELRTLVILSARYGTDESSVDITEELNKIAANGPLLLVVDDSLIKESRERLVGTVAELPKSLRLRYQINGVERAESVGENGVVQLNSRTEISKQTSGEFVLLEARRGTGLYRKSSWIDVTQRLIPFIKHESLFFSRAMNWTLPWTARRPSKLTRFPKRP